MGVSKKKLAKQTKVKTEDTIVALEEHNQAKRDATQAAKLSFSTNVDKTNLKQKREKLRSDRFKAIEYNTTSPTETVLRKRLAANAENRKKDGITLKKITVSNRKIDDEFEMGELEDIWGSERKVTSKKMESYKTTYAKKDGVSIKAVILPKGGVSYNPSSKEHKALLKTVAIKEEEIVEKNLKDLKKVRPLLYSDKQADEASEEEEEVESSEDEPVDPDASLAINAPISRTGKIKTQTDRNRIAENRAKQREMVKKQQNDKFNKDIDRIENVMKQADNESKGLVNILDKKKRAEHNELQKQEKIGEVNKPRKVGRWKYAMRKNDYQLEDDLSGNLRQMKPLGNSNLLDDRFDSIFRRGCLEPNAHDNLDKKRIRKVKYKFNDRHSTKTIDMHHENLERKKRNDIRAKGTKDIVRQEDVIMI